MSGGHFDYTQLGLTDLADDINQLIETFDTPDQFGHIYDLEADVIEYAKEAVELLRRSQIIVHRLDWLVSGDDGIETFRRLIKKELEDSKK